VRPGSEALAAEQEENSMGMLDKAKDLVSGNKDKASEGIDKAKDVVKEKTPDSADGTRLWLPM
jgi:hypothetical protein